MAILTLALGIGANTAIFLVVNACLTNPPYKRREQVGVRLVDVYFARSREQWIFGSRFPRLAAQNHSFIGMAATECYVHPYPSRTKNPRDWMEPTLRQDCFQCWAQPILGRTFLPEDEKWGQHRVVLLELRPLAG